jgi:hypothetical protein
VDWDAEKAVWDGIFSDQVLGVKFQLPLLFLHSHHFFFVYIRWTQPRPVY